MGAKSNSFPLIQMLLQRRKGNNLDSNLKGHFTQELYRELPLEINNTRQKIIKKKWSENFYPELPELHLKLLFLRLKLQM